MDRCCRVLLILAVLGAAYSVVTLVARSPGLALMAALFAGWAATRPRPPRGRDVHGSAHWCTEEAARLARLL